MPLNESISSHRRDADNQSRISLFNDIANHVYSQLQSSSEPANKKRKIEPVANSSKPPTAGNPAEEDVTLEIAEISVSVPLRKKMNICMTANYIYARAPADKEPATGTVHAWADIGSLFLNSKMAVPFYTSY